MNCNKLVNHIILWALVLTVLGDSLALVAELLNRQCEKEEEKQQAEKDRLLNQELTHLKARVAFLEKKF